MSAEISSTSVRNPGISRAWRSLRHRNFRLYFSGQGISLIGTWMTRLATSWLVYRLTGSAFLLGVVGFAGQIPTFLFAPFAGVWIDRLDRRQVLLVTQILAMIQSLALAVLTLARHINIQEIVWLSAFQGLINAFDMPARQAFLVQMVDDKQDLGNAIALNSSMVNLARLVGPSLAGVVIALSGEGSCFLIDGISYIAVIASLAAMRLPSGTVKPSVDSMLAQLKEGWAYVSGFAPVRTILLLFAMVSLMGWPFTVLMPIFAGKILRGGPHTLGFLMGAIGIGALVSAISLALRKTRAGAGPNDSHRHGLPRGRPGPVWPVADSMDFAGPDAAMWLRHDAADGRQQYHHPDHRGRQQTRPGDEFLRHGFRRNGSFRQPARRRSGECHRRASYRDVERSVLCPGSGLVRHANARHPKIDSAYLCRSRHPAGGQCGDAGRRRQLKRLTFKTARDPAHGSCTILAIDTRPSVFNNCFNIPI